MKIKALKVHAKDSLKALGIFWGYFRSNQLKMFSTRPCSTAKAAIKPWGEGVVNRLLSQSYAKLRISKAQSWTLLRKLYVYGGVAGKASAVWHNIISFAFCTWDTSDLVDSWCSSSENNKNYRMLNFIITKNQLPKKLLVHSKNHSN